MDQGLRFSRLRLAFQDDWSYTFFMARPRKSEATRLELLETGTQLLLSKGYHGTGIKDVVDRVGVPKGSFYNYFESKEDFGVQVIRHQSKVLSASFDESLSAGEADSLGALEKCFQSMLDDLRECGCGGGCLFGNLAGELDESEACRAALSEAMAEWRRHIAGALELAQQQGTARGDASAEELACFLFDCWEGALIRMKVDGSVTPLEQCMARFFDGYLRA